MKPCLVLAAMCAIELIASIEAAAGDTRVLVMPPPSHAMSAFAQGDFPAIMPGESPTIIMDELMNVPDLKLRELDMIEATREYQGKAEKARRAELAQLDIAPNRASRRRDRALRRRSAR
jgi:hypothetical protein